MKSPQNPKRLLNRAQTLLALASSYAMATVRRNRLEELGAPSNEYGDLDKAIRLYERLVGEWMDSVDEASGTGGREAAVVHASWAGRAAPLLDLLPESERSEGSRSRSNPTRARSKATRKPTRKSKRKASRKARGRR